MRKTEVNYTFHRKECILLRFAPDCVTQRIGEGRKQMVKGDCGGLNGTGPHKLIGSGTIRRCGLGGGGVVLLEEVCHFRGQALRSLWLKLCSV